jgi:hypothetical protein
MLKHVTYVATTMCSEEMSRKCDVEYNREDDSSVITKLIEI